MDNQKIPYLSPLVSCVIFSVQNIFSASIANDTLTDFNENNPVWIVD